MSANEPIPLLVVIVNFRTPKLTIDCLRTLCPEVPTIPGGMRAVVVENGSGDDSAARLGAAIDEHGWRSWATLAVSDVNRGFSGGNNWGVRQSPPSRHLLLLNSDTLVEPGCLRHCYDRLEADPTIGAMSCHLKNADGSTQIACRRLPTPLRSAITASGLAWRFPRLLGWADTEDPGWDRAAESREVEWIGGAFLWTRGEFYRSTGGLDEDFFFYGEDIEYCHRLRKAGYRIVHDPAVAITHLGGASSRPASQETEMTRINRWTARYLVQRKCYGRPSAWFLRSVDVALHAGRRLGLALLGRRHTEQYAAVRLNLATLLRPLARATPK